MISLEEAQARLLALAKPLPSENIDIAHAIGRYAARDIQALRNQPAHDLSAMDGYAVRHADMSGPWRVVGESAAGGGVPPAINAGEAVRIFTGAPLPGSADTVIIQEHTIRDGDMLSLSNPHVIAVNSHIRKAHSDFANGTQLIQKGTPLNPAHIALATLAGHGMLSVGGRPRIAILSTGDELMPPGAPLSTNQIPASNGVMLRAMLAALPCEISSEIILPDDKTAIETALSDCEADIIVTTGGASVGDHDLVLPALQAVGASMDFWKVAMRPGKPVMAGTLGNSIVLGLPGNPVSAYVTAFLFLLPLIRHLNGAQMPLPPFEHMPVTEDLAAVGPRAFLIRAQNIDGYAQPLPSTDSAVLTSLSKANLLIYRPAQAPEATKGTSVACYRL